MCWIIKFEIVQTIKLMRVENNLKDNDNQKRYLNTIDVIYSFIIIRQISRQIVLISDNYYLVTILIHVTCYIRCIYTYRIQVRIRLTWTRGVAFALKPEGLQVLDCLPVVYLQMYHIHKHKHIHDKYIQVNLVNTRKSTNLDQSG